MDQVLGFDLTYDTACYEGEQDYYYYGGASDESCDNTYYAVNVSLFDFKVIMNNTNSH